MTGLGRINQEKVVWGLVKADCYSRWCKVFYGRVWTPWIRLTRPLSTQEMVVGGVGGTTGLQAWGIYDLIRRNVTGAVPNGADSDVACSAGPNFLPFPREAQGELICRSFLVSQTIGNRRSLAPIPLPESVWGHRVRFGVRQCVVLRFNITILCGNTL